MLSGVNLKSEHSNHERLGSKHDNLHYTQCGFSTELSFLDPLLGWYTQVLVLLSIMMWGMGRNIKIIFFYVCFFGLVGSFFYQWDSVILKFSIDSSFFLLNTMRIFVQSMEQNRWIEQHWICSYMCTVILIHNIFAK